MFHKSDSTGVSAMATSSRAHVTSLSRASSSPFMNLLPSAATWLKAWAMLSFWVVVTGVDDLPVMLLKTTWDRIGVKVIGLRCPIKQASGQIEVQC